MDNQSLKQWVRNRADYMIDIDAEMCRIAVDCIEELEAKVATFLQFLDENYRHAFGDTARQKIRELYAELEQKQ